MQGLVTVIKKRQSLGDFEATQEIIAGRNKEKMVDKVRISASVVTYNNEKEIRGVLDSLMNSSCLMDMEVYVVDNCSQDRTCEIVVNEYPQVKLIHSTENVGYGAGHNQALRLSVADYHLVINPDILFDTDLVEQAVEYMENHTEVAMCIPAVYDIDGTLKFPPKRDPRIRYFVSRLLPRNTITNKWLDEYGMKPEVKSAAAPFEIEVCSGSFMVMRRKIAESIGFFDERYFMYFEDFDISRSIRTKGKIMCLPRLKVFHEGKRAAHHSKTARKMFVDSMRKYYNKWGWKL